MAAGCLTVREQVAEGIWQGRDMMNTPLHPTRVSTTRSDLLAAGFSVAEIEALDQLRTIYPYVEFLDSRQELERLRFMKWMINRDPAVLP